MPTTEYGLPYPDDTAPVAAGAYDIEALARAVAAAVTPAFVNTGPGPTEQLTLPVWTVKLGEVFSSPGAFVGEEGERQLIYQGPPRLFAVHAGAHLLIHRADQGGSIVLHHNGIPTPAGATPPGGTGGLFPDWKVTEYAGTIVLDLSPGDTLALVVEADPGFRVSQARISAWSLAPGR